MIRSPPIVRLLPVANIVALTGVSTLRLCPRMRIFSWLLGQHLAQERAFEHVVAVIQRDRDIAGEQGGARRFSSSSSLRPCAITGIGRPVASMAATSTSRLLPVPAVGDVNACSGAVAMERRSSVVRIADSATERSAAATNGNVLDQLLELARAPRSHRPCSAAAASAGSSDRPA